MSEKLDYSDLTTPLAGDNLRYTNSVIRHTIFFSAYFRSGAALMHMADALISPAVGGTMWAAAAGAIALCSGYLKRNLDDRKIPLMGVLGAFIFAAQMVNFTIPGTGSSGHIGGGMILAVLLGPAAGFVTMASVLTVQALFFADGGLLALGSNIVNLGAATCFLAYPLLFRPLAGHNPDRFRLILACLLSSVFGLQLGSFGVVAETSLSGVADLPFSSFLLLMQPIHLVIGLMEGLVTATVVSFIWRVRPDLVTLNAVPASTRVICCKRVLIPLLAAALLCGGLLSGFASTKPDGLEWAVENTVGHEQPVDFDRNSPPSLWERLQQRTAFLPGYDYRSRGMADTRSIGGGTQQADQTGTSLSGLVGGGLTLVMIMVGGGLMRIWRRQPSECDQC